MRQGRAQLSQISQDGASAADVVYAALVEAIETGQLAPGSPLREDHIASEFQVSRTPVREALARLEAQSLATRNGRRGLVVAAMTFQQILELYVVREALEGAAARLAARSGSDLEINELESLNESMKRLAQAGDAAGITSLNVEFHQLVARASHNTMLAKFIDDTYRWVRRFQTTRFSARELADAALAEHDEIVRAIQTHDESSAHEAAGRHMRNALHVRLRLERPSTPGTG